MEITGASNAPASAGTPRLHTPTKVLGGEVDATVVAAAMPQETLSRIERPGLTFSPTGLSVGSESRFIADL
ncbi:MAG: hypothetical protein WD023_00330 [Ilumatobacteraceae bacterium]